MSKMRRYSSTCCIKLSEYVYYSINPNFSSPLQQRRTTPNQTLQFTRAANLSSLAHHRSPTTLMVLHRLFRIQSRTLIECLRTRRHIQSRILVEKVHRLESHLQDLARHDGEIFDSRDMIDAKLDKEDVLVTRGPGSHTGAAAGLVRVLSTGVEFAVAVLDDVNVVVGELGAFVVEGFLVGE